MFKALLNRIPAVWQALILVGLLLGASVLVNVRLFLALHDQPLREKVASQQEALDTSAKLLADANELGATLYEAAARTKSTLLAASADYAQAAKNRPLGIMCAPGPQRQGAVNRALGAK